jgi:hypothetical protein
MSERLAEVRLLYMFVLARTLAEFMLVHPSAALRRRFLRGRYKDTKVRPRSAYTLDGLLTATRES